MFRVDSLAGLQEQVHFSVVQRVQVLCFVPMNLQVLCPPNSGVYCYPFFIHGMGHYPADTILGK